MNSLLRNLKKTYPGAEWQIFSGEIISFTITATFTITKSKRDPDGYLIQGSNYKSETSNRHLYCEISSLIKRCSQVKLAVDRLTPLLKLLNITPTFEHHNMSSFIDFNFHGLFYRIVQSVRCEKGIANLGPLRTFYLPLKANDQNLEIIKADLIKVLNHKNIQRKCLQKEYLPNDQPSELLNLVCDICNQNTELLF